MSAITLRPSKAGQWMNCPASPKMQLPYIMRSEGGSNAAAEEGTAAHWVCSETLEGRAVTLDMLAPNGVTITEDMLFYADKYVAVIRSWNAQISVEKKIDIDIINYGGTPDCFGIDHLNRKVYLIDYKYGILPVEVEKNWQLLIYLSGIIQNFLVSSGGGGYDGWLFETYIYQPRASHPDGSLRFAMYGWAELQELFEQIKKGATLVLSDEASCKTGRHCKYCEARHVCSALKKSALDITETIDKPIPNDLTLEQAENELLLLDSAMEILRARKTGIEAQIETALVKGESGKYFTVDRVKSREKWQDGAEEKIIEIGKLLGIDLSAKKALTPAQCRKLKVDEELIKQHSCTNVGEVKLVKLNLNRSKQLFGK